jgi:hypothetical protein
MLPSVKTPSISKAKALIFRRFIRFLAKHEMTVDG